MASIVRKLVGNVVGTAGLGFLNLVAAILMARWLGPERLGQYQLLATTTIVLAALGTLGLGGSNVYFIRNREQPTAAVAGTCFRITGLLSVTMLGALYALFSWEGYFGPIAPSIRWVLALHTAGLLIYTTAYPLLTAEMKILRFQICAWSPRVVLLVLVSILYARDGTLSVSQGWTALAIGTAASLLLAFWFLRDHIDLKRSLDLATTRDMVSYGLKMNLSYVVMLLNGQLILFMFRAFPQMDFADIGYFSRAVALGQLLLMIPTGLGPVLFSHWSGLPLDARTRQLERVLGLLLWIFAALVAGLWLLAPMLIPMLFGPEYTPVIGLFRVVLLGVWAQAMTQPHFRLYSSSERPLLTSLVLTISVASMFLLGLTLIGPFGLRGGAWSFAISNFIGFALSLGLSHKHMGFQTAQALTPRWVGRHRPIPAAGTQPAPGAADTEMEAQ